MGRALLVHKNDDKLFACTADIVIDVVEMMVVDGGGGDDNDVNVDITGVECACASQRNHRRLPAFRIRSYCCCRPFAMRFTHASAAASLSATKKPDWAV